MTSSQHQPIRVAIVGGSGKVARHIITQLRARRDDAVAIFRNPDRFDELAELGAIPIALDVETATVEQLAAVLVGADAVVFSAGAGGGDPARTRSVDFDGAVKTLEATRAAGVRRFVIVSAIHAGGPIPVDEDNSMFVYYQAKHDADVEVEASGLNWTILRPGSLTDDAPTGRFTVGDTVPDGSVSRADVAAAVIAAIDDPRTVGHAWELTNGDRSIVEAVAELVD